MSLSIKTTLYHGTIYEITHIDVSKGRDKKDFGKGFYMAVSKTQAIGMMHKKYREAVRRSRNKSAVQFTEKLYEITLSENCLTDLNVKVFTNPDIEWLDFILTCREQGGMPHTYDLVIGPTADDDTMLCLRAYWDGLYGEVGSSRAKQTLLENLEPENLGVQYYIGKQDVADRLIKDFKEVS